MNKTASPYRLTPLAERDLRDIARRTLTSWGEEQALIYASKLEACFSRIADKEVVPKVFSKRFPQVKCTKCEHHYVFYINSDDGKPIIIAVLYEHMDMLTRLPSRLRD